MNQDEPDASQTRGLPAMPSGPARAGLEDLLLRAGEWVLLLGVPLAVCTWLADAVMVPKSAVFVVGSLLTLWGWMRGAAGGRWGPWPTDPVCRVGVAFFLWWAAAGLWGQGGPAGVVPSLESLLLAGVLLAWSATTTPESVRRRIGICLLAGLVVAAYAWIQRLGWDPVDWSLPHLSRERTISTLGNPNYLALYLVTLLPLGLVGLLQMRPGPPRWLAGAAWLATGLAMMLTTTRGAWLAGVAGLGLFMLLLAAGRVPAEHRRDWLRTLGGLALAGLLCLGGVLAAQGGQGSFTVWARGHSFEDKSVTVRIFLWRSAWYLTLSHPFGGIGPGAFGNAALAFRYLEPVEVRSQQRLAENPHNQFLTVSVESGFPGLTLMLVWMLGWMGRALRRARLDPWAVGVAAGGASLAVGWLSLCSVLPVSLAVLLLASLQTPPQAVPPPCSSGLRAGVNGMGMALTLLGVLAATRWLTAERQVWWGDEWSIRARTGTQEQRLQLYDRALGAYQAALPGLQPQRRTELESRLGWLYREVYGVTPAPPLLQWSLEAYRRASERDPGNPYYLAFQAQVLLLQSDRTPALADQAAVLYGEALLRDPYNPVFWAWLAGVEQARGDLEAAVRALERSLEIYPDHAPAWRQLAGCLRSLGRERPARQAEQRALRLERRPPQEAPDERNP